MNDVMLKIMLEGGHFLVVSRTEQAAKELILEWENGRAGTVEKNILRGVETINGKPWHWSVRPSSVIGMHTFQPEPELIAPSMGGAPWRKSG